MNEKAISTVPSTKLLSISKVQEQLDVSRMTVNRLILTGTLPVVHIGHSVKISESALIHFINNGGQRNIKEE